MRGPTTLLTTLLFVLISHSARATESVEVDVLADTYIQNGSAANVNFSDAQELKSYHDDEIQSEILLKFEIPKSERKPDSVTIWLRTIEGHTDPVENAAYLIPDDRWAEDEVTWNSKPRYGDEMDAWITGDDHTVKIDVTAQAIEAAQDDGLLSVAIRSPHNVGSDGLSTYHSMETPGSLSSKLLIEYDVPKEYVLAGESIQKALDTVQSQGGGHVILSRGKHFIEKSLSVPSNTTLRGVGANYTTILMNQSKNEPILIASRKGRVNRDVTVRDLKLDGQQKPFEQNYPGDTDREEVRGDVFGIFFTDQDSGNKFERIRIRNVHITRCAMGIHCKGVNDLRIFDSEIRGNGCLIGYDHNIYFRRASNSLLKNLNISDCTAGNGFNLSTNCRNLILDHCNASNNNFRGIRFEASDGGSRMMIINCITNRNGRDERQPGIRVANVRDFKVINNTANDNGSYGIYCVGSSKGLIRGNKARGNADSNYETRRARDVESIDNR